MAEIGTSNEVRDVNESSETKSLGAKEITSENPNSAKECSEYWDNVISEAINKENVESNVNTAEVGCSENKVYSNLEEMKNETGKTYKEIKADKPMNSPNIVKWFEKGGKIEISMQDGKTVWTYVNPEGVKVSYIDGYPVFPPETKHPYIEDLSIGEFTGDRNEDKRLYLEKLEEEYGLTEVPEGYALHHDSENGTMQLVKEDYHKEFTHAGGHSRFKEEENANS